MMIKNNDTGNSTPLVILLDFTNKSWRTWRNGINLPFGYVFLLFQPTCGIMWPYWGWLMLGLTSFLVHFFRELELYGHCMGNSPRKYGYAEMWEYEPTSPAIVLKGNWVTNCSHLGEQPGAGDTNPTIHDWDLFGVVWDPQCHKQSNWLPFRGGGCCKSCQMEVRPTLDYCGFPMEWEVQWQLCMT